LQIFPAKKLQKPFPWVIPSSFFLPPVQRCFILVGTWAHRAVLVAQPKK
jgi:hypothetical protein